MKKKLFVTVLAVLLINVAFGQSYFDNWKWANPSPQGNQINDITTTSTYVIAVGNSGTIMMSADKGETWAMIDGGTDNQLNKIFFVDVNTGYIVGDKTILKTTDGGVNWTSPAVTTKNLNSVFFTDVSTGFATDYGTIIKTTDGGASWSLANDAYGYNHNDIFFTDANNGFISSDAGHIISTDDGGTTWTDSHITTNDKNLNQITFANADTGYVVGRYGTIFKTVNGGTNWTSTSTSTTGSAHFNDLLLIGKDSIHVVGQYDYYSNNSGSTWVEKHFHESYQYINTIARDANGYLFAAGTYGLFYVYNPTTKTWTNKLDKVYFGYGSPNQINSISFESDTKGIAVGEYAVVSGDKYKFSFQSADEGSNWENGTMGIYGNYVDYWNDSAIYTINNTSIAVRNSIDGTTIYFNSNVYFREIQALSQNTAMALDGNSTLWKTIDGGVNWQSIQLPAGANPALAFHATDPNNIFVVGNTGYYSASTDGGTTWTDMATGTANNLTDIYFVNTDTGFVVGGVNTFLKTENGGDTWTTIPTASNITKVKFHDINYGVGISYDSVYTTTNGGNTWSTSYIRMDNNLTDFAILDRNKSVFVGAYSSIVKHITTELIPAKPNNLSISQNTPGTFELSWTDNADNETSYVVYQFDKPIATLAANSTTYSHVISNQSEYSYKVLATNSNGSSAFSEKVSVVFDNTNPTIVLENPVGGEYLDVNSNLIIEWNASDNISINDIKLYFRYSNTSNWLPIDTVPATDTTYAWMIPDSLAAQVSFKAMVTDLNMNMAEVITGDDIHFVHFWDTLSNPLDYARAVHAFSNQSYIVGGFTGSENMAFKTSNNGTSWTKVNLDGGQINDFQFLDDENGFAATSNGIFKTSDGGNNWNLISDFGTTSKVFFANLNVGFAIYNGLYKTIDGGKTWEQIFDNAYYIYDVWCLTSDDVYAISSNGGNIYYSSNGGTTWTTKATNGGFNFRSIQMLTPTYGYASYYNYSSSYANYGYIYTTDGWQTYSEGNNYTRTDAVGETTYFLDTLHKAYGYSASNLYKKQNGVTTTESLNNQSNILNFDVFDENTILVAAGADLYKSNYYINLPDAPTNLAVNIDGSNNVTINWTDGTGEDFYVIYDYFKPIDTIAQNSTSYTFNTVANGTYYYRIKAISGTLYSAYSSTIVTVDNLGAGPTLSVTKPIHNSNVNMGDSIYINYEVEDGILVQSLALYARTTSADNYVLQDSIIINAIYQNDSIKWNIPKVYSNDFGLKVIAYDASSNLTYSELTLKVSDLQAPTITVLTGNENGQKFSSADTNYIKWEAYDNNYVQSVAVYVNHSNTNDWMLVDSVFTDIADIDSVAWIPYNGYSTGGQFKAIAYDTSGYSSVDISNSYFTVLDSTPPEVEFLRPLNNTMFRCDRDTIIFNATDGSSLGAIVDLFYKYTDKNDWVVIGQNQWSQGETGIFWTQPDTSSAKLQIRLYVYDTYDNMTMAISDTLIIPETAAPTLSDNFICQGDSILIGGEYILDAGEYTDTLLNMYGCDSIVTINLSVMALPNANIGPDTLIVCDGSELKFGIDTTGQNIETYTISNFTETVVDDSLFFVYNSLINSVVITVTSTYGCVNTDKVILTNNNIEFMSQNFPTVNDPTVQFSIANMPDNVDSWYWDFGDGNTSTEESPSHTYTSNGNYDACLIATNSCGNDSSCMNFDIIGAISVNQSLFANTTIYPNPSNGKYIIEDVPQSSKLIVTNVLGKVILTESINTNNYEINITEEPNGIYFIKLIDNSDKYFLVKVIKE